MVTSERQVLDPAARSNAAGGSVSGRQEMSARGALHRTVKASDPRVLATLSTAMSRLSLFIAVLRNAAAAAQRYEDLERMSPMDRTRRGAPADLPRHIFEVFFSNRMEQAATDSEETHGEAFSPTPVTGNRD